MVCNILKALISTKGLKINDPIGLFWDVSSQMIEPLILFANGVAEF